MRKLIDIRAGIFDLGRDLGLQEARKPEARVEGTPEQLAALGWLALGELVGGMDPLNKEQLLNLEQVLRSIHAIDQLAYASETFQLVK